MNILGLEIGKKAVKINNSIGDVAINDMGGLHKAYIPEFLYKPPFGYPRKENIPLIRELAKNAYIYPIIKTLCDEIASIPFDIVCKEEIEMTPELESIRKDILKFFDNPNNNKESIQQIFRAVVKDIFEVDAGVIIKVFDRSGALVELYSRDGGSFLINPDIYGYIGNRSSIIPPIDVNYAVTPESPDWQTKLNSYSLAYKETAAYFQYGTTAMALPVPFGRQEVIYIKQNPQSNSVYGVSPVQIVSDILQTLVYGAAYNLDFYMNNNMPEGVLSVIGANQSSIDSFREGFQAQYRVKDSRTNFWRKIGFKIPITNVEAKFTPFQLDPKTMQVIEQQDWFTKIVWSSFGVNADIMGFTGDSNKAVSQTQSGNYRRRAVKPLLNLLKYHIDKEIISEFGQKAFDGLEFHWDDYDLDEDKKKHDLLEQQLRMGVKSPEMVAKELGVDMTAFKEFQETKKEEEQQLQEQDNNPFEKKEEGLKSEKFENDLEKELITNLKQRSKEIVKALKNIDKGELDKIE